MQRKQHTNRMKTCFFILSVTNSTREVYLSVYIRPSHRTHCSVHYMLAISAHCSVTDKLLLCTSALSGPCSRSNSHDESLCSVSRDNVTCESLLPPLQSLSVQKRAGLRDAPALILRVDQLPLWENTVVFSRPFTGSVHY